MLDITAVPFPVGAPRSHFCYIRLTWFDWNGRNEQKNEITGMTGKPERPESWNDLKAGTT
jgi:hypothetical protein